MRAEERPFVVDEQLVEFGFDLGGIEPKTGGDAGEQSRKSGEPTAATQSDGGRGNLPDLTHRFVDQGLLALAVGCALAGDGDESAGLIRWNGKGNRPHSRDLKRRHGRVQRPGDGVFAVSLELLKCVDQRRKVGGIGDGGGHGRRAWNRAERAEEDWRRFCENFNADLRHPWSSGINPNWLPDHSPVDSGLLWPGKNRSAVLQPAFQKCLSEARHYARSTVVALSMAFGVVGH